MELIYSFLQMGQASIEFFSIAFSLSNQLPTHRILLWLEKVFGLLYLVSVGYGKIILVLLIIKCSLLFICFGKLSWI